MNKKSSWLVTFSDLITLLITFFTLIISMSSMDKKVLTQSFTFFSGGPGLMDYGAETNTKLAQLKKAYKLSVKDLRTIENIMKKYSLLPEQSFRLFMVKKYFGNDNIEIKIENVKDIIVISDCNKIFQPISYQFKDYGYEFAQAIYKTLKLYKGMCKIEVYTSKFPVETDIIKDNVDLAIKRASYIVDFLIKKNINYKRIEIIGWGNQRKPEFSVKYDNVIVIKFINILKTEEGKVNG